MMSRLLPAILLGILGGYGMHVALQAPEPERYKLEQYQCKKAYYYQDGKEKFKDIAMKLSFSTAIVGEQFGVIKMNRTGEETAIQGDFKERDGILYSPQQVRGGGVAISVDRKEAYLTIDGKPEVVFKLGECETVYKYN